jgi:hypothetical protein
MMPMARIGLLVIPCPPWHLGQQNKCWEFDQLISEIFCISEKSTPIVLFCQHDSCIFLFFFFWSIIAKSHKEKGEKIMKSQYRMPLVFVVLLLAVGLACFGGGTVPVATQPPVNVEPPVVATVEQPQTEAPVAAEPPATEASTAPDFFTEEFDGDISNWTYFTSKNDSTADDSSVNPIAENSVLTLDLSKYLNVYVMYDPFTYTNVRVDARVENRGTNNNNINLVCRYSDEGWYEVSIANNGLYDLYAYDGAKGSYAKLANGGSNKIKTGKEVNEYTFICNERNLILKVNGIDTKTFTDNQYVFREGQIGIGASSFRDVPVKVEFDWVKISEP